MKNFLFAILLAAGLGALAPEAKADNHQWHGNYNRYHGRYSSRYDDRHHHYYSDRGYRTYYRGDRYYHSRPVVVYRHRPVRVYEDYGYYAPRVRYYESRPRFSFFFGL